MQVHWKTKRPYVFFFCVFFFFFFFFLCVCVFFFFFFFFLFVLLLLLLSLLLLLQKFCSNRPDAHADLELWWSFFFLGAVPYFI